MLQYPNNIYDYVLSRVSSPGRRKSGESCLESERRGENISTPASERKNEREKERVEEGVYDRANGGLNESERERDIYVELTHCKRRVVRREKRIYKITLSN